MIYILALLIFQRIYHSHTVIPSHSATLSGFQLFAAPEDFSGTLSGTEEPSDCVLPWSRAEDSEEGQGREVLQSALNVLCDSSTNRESSVLYLHSRGFSSAFPRASLPAGPDCQQISGPWKFRSQAVMQGSGAGAGTLPRPCLQGGRASQSPDYSWPWAALSPGSSQRLAQEQPSSLCPRGRAGLGWARGLSPRAAPAPPGGLCSPNLGEGWSSLLPASL